MYMLFKRVDGGLALVRGTMAEHIKQQSGKAVVTDPERLKVRPVVPLVALETGRLLRAGRDEWPALPPDCFLPRCPRTLVEPVHRFLLLLNRPPAAT